MSAFQVSYALLWAVACLLVIGVAAIYSSFGAMQMRSAGSRSHDIGGPEVGAKLTVPPLLDIREQPVNRSARRWIFVSSDCRHCDVVKQELNARPWIAADVVIVCRGHLSDVEQWSADLVAPVPLVVDEDGSVCRGFGISVWPFYVRLDTDNTCVARGVLGGASANFFGDIAATGAVVARI